MSNALDDELNKDSGNASRVFPQSPREAIEPEAAPPPPRRRRDSHPFIAILNGTLTLVTLAVIALGIGFLIASSWFESPGSMEQTKTVLIARGEGVSRIAERLKREGVIDNTMLFRGGVYFKKVGRDLKAGEYLFQANASVSDVIDTLVGGKAILHTVTVPEGRTSWDIVQILNAEPLLEGEIKEIPAEGELLPETYKFTRATSRQEMLNRMAAAHDKLLEEIWPRRASDLPIESKNELVTLASIVEKETGRANERSRVAGVFVNRLQRGMRLQSDPTIIYGITKGKESLGRGLRRSEIDAVTPYNTYQIDGLPPTPIANPGRASLEAVANPSRTEDLYFVADGTGGHAFAKSLDEHNDNVANWRRIEKKRGEQAEAGESTSDTSN